MGGASDDRNDGDDGCKAASGAGTAPFPQQSPICAAPAKPPSASLQANGAATTVTSARGSVLSATAPPAPFGTLERETGGVGC